MLTDGQPLTASVEGWASDTPWDEPKALRDLFDSLLAGIVIQTPEGRVLDANRAWCEMHGITLAQAKQLRITDLSHPSMSPERGHRILQKALAGEPQLFEWKSIRADNGHEFDSEVFIKRVVIHGQVLILSSVWDITERKKVEEQLRIQSTALSSAANAICITNKDGVIQWVNPAFCQLTGYSREEVLRENPRILKSGDHPPEFYDEMWKTISSGKPWSGTLSNRRKDGSLYVEEMMVTPVKNEQGAISHYIAIKQDFTERKKAEEALERQNLRLLVLNDIAEALMSNVDTETTLNAVYNRMAKYFQIDNFVEFKLSDDGSRLDLVCLKGPLGAKFSVATKLQLGEGIAGKVAETGKPIVVSNAMASTDPDLRFVRDLGANAYACEPLRIGERLYGTLSFASTTRSHFEPEDQEFFRTIAGYVAIAKERQRLDGLLKEHADRLEQAVRERTMQLVEANANLQTFAYTAAHDLRSPLRSILGFSMVALEEHGPQLPEGMQMVLNKVIGSAKQMTALLNDLLEYSQLNQAELKLTKVDLRGAANEALALLEDEIRAKSADVSVSGEMPCVLAHPATLAVVIANLLSNALKFIPSDRKPLVKISADAKGSLVRISVEDNGIGIAQADQVKLFQLFCRLHGKGVYPGTGLGLALVKRGVERLGGTVGVTSEPGKGSCFWIELQSVQ